MDASQRHDPIIVNERAADLAATRVSPNAGCEQHGRVTRIGLSIVSWGKTLEVAIESRHGSTSMDTQSAAPSVIPGVAIGCRARAAAHAACTRHPNM